MQPIALSCRSRRPLNPVNMQVSSCQAGLGGRGTQVRAIENGWIVMRLLVCVLGRLIADRKQSCGGPWQDAQLRPAGEPQSPAPAVGTPERRTPAAGL